MASVVAENWGHVDGHDESEVLELSQINHNLLMSLLDETPIEECDDERLRKVIRSLEAEIDSDEFIKYDFDDHNVLGGGDHLVDCQSSNDEINGQDPRMMHHDLDDHLHNWMDMEISMPTSPPRADGVDGWSMYHDEHGMIGGVNEFGWVKNYAPYCYVMNAIDQDQDCSSFWHDINVNAIQ